MGLKNELQFLAVIAASQSTKETLQQCKFENTELRFFKSGVDFFSAWEKDFLPIIAILAEDEITGANGVSLRQIIQRKKNTQIPFFILANNHSAEALKTALKFGVADVFKQPLKKNVAETRINFLAKNWSTIVKQANENAFITFKTPFIKRLFDICFSGGALLALSPLFLAVIVALKLESKGPAFYYSLRVGSGYKIFKFFKFRSMFVNADKRLKDLAHLNQYGAEASHVENNAVQAFLCEDCIAKGVKCQSPFYADENTWCEKEFNQFKKAKDGSAFFKLKDDPRITKVGKILRNTSIDELPQLWNVLIGDMSIVGNRPLPLYEAEKLTTDKYSLRFMAPAGITGLWQVEKRGKGEMSEDERLMLDNKYAKNHSFANDIRLILKTIPALFQKENV
jgi:lipopolysaccharide/colanic/teichoic acid biosynthesis glycosyltransferase